MYFELTRLPTRMTPVSSCYQSNYFSCSSPEICLYGDHVTQTLTDAGLSRTVGKCSSVGDCGNETKVVFLGSCKTKKKKTDNYPNKESHV